MMLELQLRILESPRDTSARSALNLLCAQLRRRGYSLQAMAEILDLSREAVRQKTEQVPDELLSHILPDASTMRQTPSPLLERPRAWLTAEEVARARELIPVAARHRAPTPPDSEVGRAFGELMNIYFAGEARGVTTYTMAQQLDLTPAAIKHRMARVRGTLPPSMRPLSTDGAPPTVLDRPGRLGDFSPETTPNPAEVASSPG
ncbi:hypothetical protein [Kribbella amoyensis]|nr:hypothetical protein [Kribbella amoyensis]